MFKAIRRWLNGPVPAPAVIVNRDPGNGLFSTHTDYAPGRGRRLLQQMPLGMRFEPPVPVHVVGNDVAAMDDDNGDLGLLSAKPSLNGRLYDVSEAQLLWYASQGFIGYQLCAIIAQQWLVDKACSMPAKDAVRKGFDLTVNEDMTGGKSDTDSIAINKMLAYVTQRNKHFGIIRHCIQFIRMGRIFGIRHALFVVEGADYSLPFNIDGIKPGTYKGISQIDPYWITPLLSPENVQQPGSMTFYEPDFWMVAGYGPIHRSWLRIFTTGAVADILKPVYNYGGVSVTQRIYERIYAAERTANEAPMLAMTKRLTTMSTDLTEAISNPALFAERMQWWTETRDNYGVKINGQDDKVEQFDINLNDMDSLTMTQYQLVASIAEVPGTKLLGTQPKGFNSTGEYEETSYHEFLESLRENDVTPLLDMHHRLVCKSEIEPKFARKLRIDVSWPPLDAMSALEEAQVNLAMSENDAVQVGIGSIDAQDVRNRIIADKSSGYNGLPSALPPMPDMMTGMVPATGAPAQQANAGQAPPAKPGAKPAQPSQGGPGQAQGATQTTPGQPNARGNARVAALAPKPTLPRIKAPPGA